MRQALILLVPLLALAACDQIVGLTREASVGQCAAFYRYSRDPEMNEASFRQACTCAVDREAAGQTPVAGVPPRPNPALGEYRRHLPDCIAANGGRATGVAARESAGEAPRPATFDPATGRWSEPPDQVTPGPDDGGEPPPPEEPPPSLNDPFPSPVVQEVPQPGDVSAPNQPGANAH